ncbi:MAG: prolyl oligopeptidase family serine peptidase [Actinobacteria bacterium]|nr:prolyl oligopeptidase family serine peptidase [Actinomycetota bacterium]
MTTLPYGSWPSPISAADLTAAAVGLSRGLVDDDRVYWTEAYPRQGGRVALWVQEPDGSRRELAPEHSVRNSINEYGGGAWAVAGGVVVYSDHPSGDLWVLADGERRRLASGGALRYGCLVVVPDRRLVLAVVEDHTRSDQACEQRLVALDLDADNADGGRVLAAGADFYASPALRDDGLLAWVQWQLPDMPWDASDVWVAPLDAPGQARKVAGGPGNSVLYPAWAADGSLLYLDDASGFWNFHRWDGSASTPVHTHPWDFCGPMWTPDPAPYSLLPDGRIACTWVRDWTGHLGVLDPADGSLAGLPTGAVGCELSGRGDRVVALFGYADRPAELRLLDLAGNDSTLLRRASEVHLPPGLVSVARSVTWDSPDGPVQAWYYPPTNPDVRAPEEELPPVQVWSHGGPTAFSESDLRLTTQFWTSRGIGILDVNYSGSAGAGRAYRERLDGAWGVADVRDCVDGALALVAAGMADGERLSIRGGSAGGYTTLAALTSSDVFAAGISLYGIGDLETLVADTHKFESGYTERLVAPYPEGRETYRERSPIHHLDRLACPMLILQGRLDRVVPPEQAEAMAAAVAARGLPVELVWFDEEGHGFRRAESIIATAEHALAFLGRVHGFTPA